MLRGRLTLHDITDVEAYTNAYLHRATRNRPLEQADYDDALAWLVSETWRISRRYDPARYPSFAALVRTAQPRLLVQWYRDRFIDRRYARRYTAEQWRQIEGVAFPVSLDAPAESDIDGSKVSPSPDRSTRPFTQTTAPSISTRPNQSTDNASWSSLSPLSEATLRQTAPLLLLGLSRREIATVLGIRPSLLSSLLTRLETELREGRIE